MSYENLLKWVFSPFDSAKNNFSQSMERLKEVTKNKNSQLEVVTNFFKEFKKLEIKYKNDLVAISLKFQKKINEAFNDQRITKFFQLVFEKLFQRCNQITQTQDFVKDLTSKINASNKNLRKCFRDKTDAFQKNSSKFADLLTKSHTAYTDYLDECRNLTSQNFQKNDDLEDNDEEIADLIQMVEMTTNTVDQVKLLQRIVEFKSNIGKRTAQKIMEKANEKGSVSNWSNNEVRRFNRKWEDLKEVMHKAAQAAENKSKQERQANTDKMLRKKDRLADVEKKRFGQLSQQMFVCLAGINGTVEDCLQAEATWKDKLQKHLMAFMFNYFPLERDQIRTKAKLIKKTVKASTSKFTEFGKVCATNPSHFSCNSTLFCNRSSSIFDS